MKVLLDSCVSGKLRQPLVEAGHDVLWIGEWETDPGDELILTFAHQESRVLVTLDKDFGTLAVVQGRPHFGILRLVNLSVSDQLEICRHVLDNHGTELESGAIVTAEQDRLRIRMPD